MLGRIEFPLLKRARLPNALRAFGWVSGNWNPLKGAQRLPRVDPPGRGVTGSVIEPSRAEPIQWQAQARA